MGTATSMEVDNNAVEKRKRRSRCGTCDACKRPNCGKCGPCKGMVQFGGCGTRKEACVHRRCPSLRLGGPPTGTRDDEDEDDEEEEGEVVELRPGQKATGSSSTNIVPKTSPVPARREIAARGIQRSWRSPGISEEKEEAEPSSPEPEPEQEEEAEPHNAEPQQRQQEDEAKLVSPYEKKKNLESALRLFWTLEEFLDFAEGSNNCGFSNEQRTQIRRYTSAIHKTGNVFREGWLRAQEECEGFGELSPPDLLLLCLSSNSFARADIATLKLLCRTFNLHEVVKEAANEWNLTSLCPLIVQGDSNILHTNKKLLKCVVFVSRVYHATKVLQYSPEPFPLRDVRKVLRAANTMLEKAANTMLEKDRKRKSRASLEEQPKKKSHISGHHSPEQALATITNAPTLTSRSEDAKLPARPRHSLQGENGELGTNSEPTARTPAAANRKSRASLEDQPKKSHISGRRSPEQAMATVTNAPMSPSEDAKLPARPRHSLQGENDKQGTNSEPTARTTAAANAVPVATDQGLALVSPQAPQATASTGQGAPSHRTIHDYLQLYCSFLGQEKERHKNCISCLQQEKVDHEDAIARLRKEIDGHVDALSRLQGEVDQENKLHEANTKDLKEKKDMLKNCLEICEQDVQKRLRNEV